MSHKSGIERYRYFLYGCSLVLGVAFSFVVIDSTSISFFVANLVVLLVSSIILSIVKVNSIKNKVLLNALRIVLWTAFIVQIVILVGLLGAIGGAP